ncbi:MAG TPA: hypothetical protein VHE61_10145 [Opitutaceae bacterium]|nr:hypothetical protein [Opitutaceae bacterium]
MFPAFPSGRVALLAIVVAVASASPVFGFTQSGTTFTTTGLQADVSAAIAAATDGCVIRIPTGTFTWGASRSAIAVNKAVVLEGAGPGNTIINLDPTGPTGTTATIQITAAATIKGFTLNGAASVVAFSTSTTSGWRITDITYNAGTDTAYFCFVDQGYGLIDSCNITGGGGTDELIFVRGPLNSWQTPNSLGGANNTFIEDCTFNGPGYVCDANANARVVVRFCTITGQMKIDGHGFASNSPRGIREIEVYNNHWTYNASGAFWEIELRGGTGMVFNNVSDMTSAGLAWYSLTDYGYQAIWPNFGSQYQTPLNYPLTDQIGVGTDPKAEASEPMYSWNNLQNGAKWPRSLKTVNAGAITLYQQQIANLAATFTEADIIKADRDVYLDLTVSGTFNGSTGVGTGSTAAMNAITPPAQNSVPKYPDGTTNPNRVGFWVTDQGSWNTKLGANQSGELYVWNGSSWMLKYVPYTYPHPQRAPIAPTNLRISTP